MSGCAVGAKTVGSHTGPGTEVRDRGKEGAGTLDGQAAGWTSRGTYTGDLSWPQDESPASPASTMQGVVTSHCSFKVAPLEMAPTVGGGYWGGGRVHVPRARERGGASYCPGAFCGPGASTRVNWQSQPDDDLPPTQTWDGKPRDEASKATSAEWCHIRHIR